MGDWNKGYLTAKTNKKDDEVYTPEYAIYPLLKYLELFQEKLNHNITIWCPFDMEWSNYVRIFKKEGYNVIYSHIDIGQNFFFYEPQEDYDIIISNPPFSQKDNILKRLYELNKPYAILLPITSFQGKTRFSYMKDNLQFLGFNIRINFYADQAMSQLQKGIAFATGYFCKYFLPKDLILEELSPNEK